MKTTIYIDGQYLKVEAKILEAFTPGVFQGEGVFETMLAIGHKVFDMKEHLKRLHSCFPKAGITPQMIERVVKANGFSTSRVRILVWKHKGQMHRAVMALKYTYPKDKVFKVCLIKTNRPANARLANQKSLNYKLFADAYAQARAKGFDESLLLNTKGYLFEASRANVFILTKTGLITPPLSSGCLKGITRQKLIKAARQMGIPVSEKNITPSVLKSAKGIFLTNSLLGIKVCQLG